MNNNAGGDSFLSGIMKDVVDDDDSGSNSPANSVLNVKALASSSPMRATASRFTFDNVPITTASPPAPAVIASSTEIDKSKTSDSSDQHSNATPLKGGIAATPGSAARSIAGSSSADIFDQSAASFHTSSAPVGLPKSASTVSSAPAGANATVYQRSASTGDALLRPDIPTTPSKKGSFWNMLKGK